ncbi:hypothetical protein VD0002_g1834 [Verticillium dahliae]|uniref:Uncharacterized protein n=1 Tax=Verticillium dahliae TaxID=27337 RepID=A0AA44WAQ0_VERDA|nr:hypothetical protein BJF96_g8686 [Verticillium dahliae]PNH46584.1 hypothetical protein VD0004_g1541 [Verticillium dahliae]PNH54136.1 hypothetical protein VD0003_g3377 [Verticillium dahliae]PNH68115.1 hypothetical protein VD0002_g1834 [Verticillium dahliae]PNH76341.1 hypothetical protein VD0001_g1290 [Verticillium dahliae]
MISAKVSTGCEENEEISGIPKGTYEADGDNEKARYIHHVWKRQNIV